MPHLDTSTIQLILVALVALALLVQALILFATFIVLRKLARSILEEIQDLRSSITPVIDRVRELVTRLSPKVEDTAADLAVLTRALRNQMGDVQAAADDIVARARRQASRIDALLSSVLDALERAGVFMAETISKPMHQLSAFLASAKAAIESLRNGEDLPRAEASRTSVDRDRFV
jgi:methyl-accepting chemotaxis protein